MQRKAQLAARLLFWGLMIFALDACNSKTPTTQFPSGPSIHEPLEPTSPLEPIPTPIASAAVVPNTNLLQNNTFEADGLGWSSYLGGFSVEASAGRAGSKALKLVKPANTQSYGARQEIIFNQTSPQPIYFCGYSKAQGVSGSPDINYSLYLDIRYTDGTYQYQRTLNFATGTHDWQFLEATFQPAKPIAWVRFYALLRPGHSGTVWFDDVCLMEVGSNPTPPPAPPAPGSFAAVAVSSTQINLSWGAAAGASGYTLERKTGTGSYSAIQTALTGTSYSDAGLSPSTRYDYRLKAKNSGGESTAVETNATTLEGPPAPPPPPAPTNLLQNPDLEGASGVWANYLGGFTLDPSGGRGGGRAIKLVNPGTTSFGASQQVNLNQTSAQPIYFCGYSKAQGVSGSPDINYSIYLDIRYTDGSNLWGQTINFATGTHDWQFMERTLQLAKPVAWLRYYVLLRPNHSGTVWFDDLCLSSSGSTPPPPPPTLAAPTGFLATAASSSQINLTWSAVSGASGYSLERKTASTSYSVVQSNLPTPSYSDVGLSAETLYTYRLKAKNSTTESAGVEASATTLSITPPPPPSPPSPPSNFAASVVSSSQINLSWSAVGGATSYVLERKTGTASYAVLQNNLSATSYSDTGLSPATRYDYRLKAKNSSSESSAVEANATTLAAPPPPPPPPANAVHRGPIFERIVVSGNGRYFVGESGKPVFLLGDTNWFLANAATREEVVQYLNDRKAKGYNTILSTTTAQIVMTNRYGFYPFEHLVPSAPSLQEKGYDFSKPVEGYWTHMDYVIDQANQMGFLVQMNVMWGNLSGGPYGWRIPVGWTDAKALEYGRFLGRRYGQKRVIWMVGGDDRFDAPCNYSYGCTSGTDRLRWYGLMVQGLKETAHPNTLYTFHPAGGLTSFYVVGNPSWLSFHSHQSGHINHIFTSKVPEDYPRIPTKPIVDIEPLYEDNALWDFTINNWSRNRPVPYDIRRIQYWDALSGAAGVVYGHLAVAVMYTKPGNEYLGAPSMTWKQGLSGPAAAQMVHLINLMTSRPYHQGVPDTSLVVDSKGSGVTTVTALAAPSFAFIYLPNSRSVSVNVSRFGPTTAWWYNPQTGQSQRIGDISGIASLGPAPYSPDAVLVLDQTSANYAAPGQ